MLQFLPAGQPAIGAIASGNAVSFAADTIEVIYYVSGGVPRLVNLLCERALQQAADAGPTIVLPRTDRVGGIGAGFIRLKPKRFRWHGSK